ncbi:MAG: tripartite tricarboxylate transporter substrate binding protein [Betaproteobacteria bacterium]|nr:tripartite tricarboxylate transporter substrate binding protein [Betaproteobacteria bacterium]
MRTIRISGLAWLVMSVFSSVATAWAQNYPTKPIRFIVPFAPGGGVDLIGRTIGQKLNEAWGQPVVVDNRGGGGGNIGTDMVAKAPPDGHTLLMGYVGNLAINPFLFKKLPYDPLKDFSPITLAATAPNVLVAHPSLPANSVKELVALAKAKPNALNYASAGNGTVGHMVAELFKTETATQITHIPYKGNGPALTDVLAGQVPLMFSAPGAVLAHVRAGKLKALAVASARREPGLSDVPTFAEFGYPTVEAQAWYGVLTAAGTPKDIVAKLNRDVVRIMQLPDVKERLAAHGYQSVTNTPEQFRELIRTDLVKWEKVVKASGAHVD